MLEPVNWGGAVCRILQRLSTSQSVHCCQRLHCPQCIHYVIVYTITTSERETTSLSGQDSYPHPPVCPLFRDSTNCTVPETSLVNGGQGRRMHDVFSHFSSRVPHIHQSGDSCLLPQRKTLSFFHIIVFFSPPPSLCLGIFY